MPDDPAIEEDEVVAPEPPPRPLPTHPVLLGIIEPFEDAEWSTPSGQHVVMLPKGQLREFGAAAKAAGFEMAVDVTAVDYLGKRRIRYELVVNFLSVEHGLRLRVRSSVPADDASVPSLVPVYPGTNFFEREVYDMFGITFEDHPDMTRILMPDDWEGHPLRKDFGLGDVPVQFKEANRVS